MTAPDHTPAERLSRAAPAPLGAPRLRIIHVMFWTACTAVFLVLMRLRTQLPERGSVQLLDPHADESPLAMALRLLMAIGYGVGVGTLLLIPIWRLRRYRTPAYPGDWLLIVTAVWMVVVMLYPLGLWLVDWLLELPELHRGPKGYFILNIFAQGIGLVSCLLAVLLVKQLGWRCLFAAFLALHLLSAASSFFDLLFTGGIGGNWLNNILRIVYWQGGVHFLVPVLFLVLLDLKRGCRFSWTHWLGVGLFAWHRGAMLVQRIWIEQAIEKANG